MSHKRRWTNYWNPYTKYMTCGVASVVLVCLVLMLGAWACPHYLRCSAVSKPSTAHDFMHRLWESTNHTHNLLSIVLYTSSSLRIPLTCARVRGSVVQRAGSGLGSYAPI